MTIQRKPAMSLFPALRIALAPRPKRSHGIRAGFWIDSYDSGSSPPFVTTCLR